MLMTYLMSYVLYPIHLMYVSLMRGRVMLTCDSFALVGWTSTPEGGYLQGFIRFWWTLSVKTPNCHGPYAWTMVAYTLLWPWTGCALLAPCCVGGGWLVSSDAGIGLIISMDSSESFGALASFSLTLHTCFWWEKVWILNMEAENQERRSKYYYTWFKN